MNRISISLSRAAAFLPVALLLIGCGGDNTYSPTVSGSGGTPPVVAITIESPNPAQTVIGGTLQYAATVTGATDQIVDWSVVTANGGSISSAGLYTAPGKPGTYTIKATADADKTKFATATATVVANQSVSITITPPDPAQTVTGGTLQYQATVTGSTNTKVDWSVVTANGGSISSAGLYQAPGNPGTYTIKATADADKTKFATATATVISNTGGLGGTIQ